MITPGPVIGYIYPDYITSASLGYASVIFLTANKQVLIAGTNSDFQLCSNSTNGALIQHTPTPIKDYNNVLVNQTVKSVHGANTASLILTNDGKLFACGRVNENGSIKTYLVPAPFVDYFSQLNGRNITTLSAHYNFIVMVTSDGQLFSYGSNSKGVLGNGLFTDRWSIGLVLDGYNSFLTQPQFITKVSCGNQYCLALNASGSVFSWVCLYVAQYNFVREQMSSIN